MTFIFFHKIKGHLSGKSELLWLTIGQVISILFSLIMIKIITKIGPSDFGIYSLILSVSGLFSALLVGPSEQGFIRYFYNFNKIEQTRRFLNVVYIFFILTASFIILISWFFYLLKIFKDLNSLLIGCFIISFTFSSFFLSLFNLIRKRKLNTLLIIFEKFLTTILLYLLYILENLNISNVLIVLSISILIGLTARIIYFNRVFEYKVLPNFKMVGFREFLIYKKIFLFSLPLVIWGIANWLGVSSDRWIIVNFTNLNIVGIYSLMMALSSYLIATPIGVIVQYFQPIIFEQIINTNSDSNKSFDNFIRGCIIIVFFGLMFSIFFGKLVLSYIAIEYSVYWYFLPFFCVSIGVFQIAQSYTLIGMIHEKPKIYLMPKIILGLISFIFNVIGIYYFKLNGLTVSMICSSSIYLILIIRTNRKFQRKYNNENITYS